MPLVGNGFSRTLHKESSVAREKSIGKNLYVKKNRCEIFDNEKHK